MSRPGVTAGMRRNMLVAIREDRFQSKNKRWLFQCDCGNQKVIRASSFLTGRTKSCGCLNKKLTSERMSTHGMSRTPLFASWSSMRARCLNPNATGYSGHGGRGITICADWVNDFNAFSEWSQKNGYQPGMMLDRIDNDGNYCPENCQWLTKSDHTKKTHMDLGERMWRGYY